MVLGILNLRIVIREARSLKDKRRIINSLKDRIKNEFNVSVAEVAQQDHCQTGSIGIAQVSSDARYVRSSLERAVDLVRGSRKVQVADYDVDVFHD